MIKKSELVSICIAYSDMTHHTSTLSCFFLCCISRYVGCERWNGEIGSVTISIYSYPVKLKIKVDLVMYWKINNKDDLNGSLLEFYNRFVNYHQKSNIKFPNITKININYTLSILQLMRVSLFTVCGHNYWTPSAWSIRLLWICV